MVEISLRPESARRYIASQLNRPVSRTSFYRWRKELNWIGPKYRYYCPSALEALTVFGNHVSAGWRLEDAKMQAINYLRSQND